jgi:hypothetical protein
MSDCPRSTRRNYVHRPGALTAALAATMSIPQDRRPEVKVESLSHVVQSSENEYRKFLLTEFVSSYLPLTNADEQSRFDVLLQSNEYVEVKKMMITWYEQGLEAGLKKGKLEAILVILEDRFGPLPIDLRQRLESCPDEKITELIKRVSQAESIDDLVGFEFDH